MLIGKAGTRGMLVKKGEFYHLLKGLVEEQSSRACGVISAASI